ncbi:MAG: hypothetical protein SPK32_11670, partial [Bacteroidaceae bacterium]|nr:hypothetical protein [Bacteroidaceae bacterium]
MKVGIVFVRGGDPVEPGELDRIFGYDDRNCVCAECLFQKAFLALDELLHVFNGGVREEASRKVDVQIVGVIVLLGGFGRLLVLGCFLALEALIVEMLKQAFN